MSRCESWTPRQCSITPPRRSQHQSEDELVRHDCTKAKIVCRCGYEWDLCVPVGLTVPEPLWCRPGRSIVLSTRSDIGCPGCGFTLFRSEHELRSCIEDELCRAREHHARYGTVVVRLR